MMRILLLGGAGYVGCVTVPLLLAKGHQVRVMDNLMYGQCVLLGHFIDRNFEFMYGDITLESDVKKAVADMDIVINLAAMVGAPACQIDPHRAETVNVKGASIVNQARGNRPLIYPSTVSVYGELREICTEESPVNPLSWYGETKYLAEQGITSSDNFVVFRPATAFGVSPRMRLDLLINDFTYQAAKTRNLVVYEGGARRSFVHVRDFGRALVHAVENFERMKNTVFNLGSEKMNLTKREIVDKIRKHINFYIHYAEFGSDPDKRDYEVSYARLRKAGFEAEISVDEGIQELIRGYQMVAIRNPYSNYVR